MTTTFNNLREFLQGETAYHRGRMLYKYTDCGPWITYTVLDKPARVERYAIEIRETPTGLVAKSMAGPSYPVEDALQFLGFDADGTNSNKWRSRNALYRRIDAFFRKERNPLVKMDWTLERNALCIGCLRIELSRQVPATFRDIYYEDDEANALDIPGCVGVEVGSIVEGCDSGIDGRTLEFPFTEEQFDELVRGVNYDACAVWDWANVRYDKRGRRHPNGKTLEDQGCDWPLL